MRTSNKILDLKVLQKRLDEIPSIDGFNVFGGEISLLQKSYLVELKELLQNYSQNITVNTNLTNLIPFEVFNDVSISLNEEREDYEFVKRQLPTLPYKFSLSTVVFDGYENKDMKQLLDSYNYDNCVNVTFMEYSPTRFTNQRFHNDTFDKFLIKLIQEYDKRPYNYSISNIGDLESCLVKRYDPKMSSNMFINPYGNFGSVKHTKDFEYFVWHKDYNDYQTQCITEEIVETEVCEGCPYIGHCYAEHLSPYICKGHRMLLDWYRSYKC